MTGYNGTLYEIVDFIEIMQSLTGLLFLFRDLFANTDNQRQYFLPFWFLISLL